MDFYKQKTIHLILRIAVAMCFIGHGAFGIITKAVWCNYFAVFGIGEAMAYRLMPAVGIADILLGISMLVYPVRAVPAWLVCWGLVTAMLRPVSGEPFAEFIERAGNFGAPFCLLLLSGFPNNWRGWFSRMDTTVPADAANIARVTTCLKIVAFLLLLGHGWLNVIGKPGLLKQYANLGFAEGLRVAQVVGTVEIIAAFTLLIKPLRGLLLLFFIWKITSEMFYPQFVVFEWIERGGSYGVLLALWVITEHGPAIRFNRGKDYSLQNA